jgi:hypothetical protein
LPGDKKDLFDGQAESARVCALEKIVSFEEEAKTMTEGLAIAKIGLRRAELRVGASEVDLIEAELAKRAAEARARSTSLKIEQVSSLIDAYLSEAQKIMQEDLKDGDMVLSDEAQTKVGEALDRAKDIDGTSCATTPS